MNSYYPKDSSGNVIGFKTPESLVYDTSGVSLTDKLQTNSSTMSNLASRVTDAEDDIVTQTARIDAITSLPSGSTSGDAELMDIRVKADGTTASSAGNAVREQVTDLLSRCIGANSTTITDDNVEDAEYNSLNNAIYFNAIYAFHCSAKNLLIFRLRWRQHHFMRH